MPSCTRVTGNTFWMLATSRMVVHLPWWAIVARTRQTKIVENIGPCPSPSLHYSEADDSLNTKTLTLADCGYCEGKVVVRP